MCFNFFKKNKKTNVEPQITKVEENVVEPENYAFMLTTEDVTGRIGGKTIFDPTENNIDEAISVLMQSDNNFLVLSSKTPINRCTFMQATGFVANDRTVYVEVQRIERNNGTDILSNYGNMIDINTCRDLLKAFLHNSTPDIASWDHMMDFDME